MGRKNNNIVESCIRHGGPEVCLRDMQCTRTFSKANEPNPFGFKWDTLPNGSNHQGS